MPTESDSQSAPFALDADSLHPHCDPATLGCSLSSELEPIEILPGHGRAMDALAFGAGISHQGYNIFVLGSDATGRHTAVENMLRSRARQSPPPSDWVYVHNFANDYAPQAIQLPTGTGPRFKRAMEILVADLRGAVRAVFEGEDYQERRRKIDEHYQHQHNQAFEELSRKARDQNIGILRTPMGFALAPMRDGNVIKPEDFNALPEDERRAVQTRIERLQEELGEILRKVPELEKRRREQIAALNTELGTTLVDVAVASAASEFADIAAIQTRLRDVRKDLIDNIELFLGEPQSAPDNPIAALAQPADGSAAFRRYMVNVVITDGDGDSGGGAPVVYENHPTLARLLGRIEHISRLGALVTDFTMIRPGAVHRANGGYLILDAHKILREPWAWDGLKRALRANTISIASAAEEMSLISTVSLDPQPIPLSIKVVLIGERMLYYLLAQLDPDFQQLFKVQADFDDDFERTPDNMVLYARLIAAVARNCNLRPLEAGAIAAVIDEASRLASDRKKLSLQVGRTSDLMREADYWAAEAGRDRITRHDVEAAIEQQTRRAGRLKERSHESISRGVVLIDTDGARIGQVNGLSVLSLGNTSFGKPSRITARVRSGVGKVIDIERETELGGPIHAKGVLILSSFLTSTYATDWPVSLQASLVFEQSYGGVEGDSASSAELYALLSALSGVPILQSFAVTGSVNQLGQVQAIGGVNEKIEGFFDICSERGLTGRQGVLIPRSNVDHLVLRPRVVEAVRARRFAIHAVSSIDEGIGILTGRPAGVRDRDGRFQPDSVNALVERRLEEFARARKRFAAKDDGAGDGA